MPLDSSGIHRCHAPPLLCEAEAAAAPRESFGFQRGLVAPAFASGATAIDAQGDRLRDRRLF